MKLERLKPRLAALEKSHGFLQNENMTLKNHVRLLSFQSQNETKKFETLLADQRKKLIKSGAAGLLLGLLAGALIH